MTEQEQLEFSETKELVEIMDQLPSTISDLEQALKGVLEAPPDQSVVKELGVGAEYLPYLVIVQNGSPLTEEPQSIPVTHLALRRSRNVADDLGPSMDVYICTWRTKAMYSDPSKKDVRSIYDRNDPMFKEWCANAEDKITGFWWGFEFLMYHGDIGEFFTFFCNNPTLRRAANECLIPNTQRVVTISTTPLKDGSYKWQGIKAAHCSTPFAKPPSLSEIKKQTERFTRKDKEIEDLEDVGEDESRER